MPFQPPRRRGRRLTTTIPIVLALLAGMVAATMPAAAAKPAARASGKVERQVLDALASAGTATFFVMLRDEADLSAAASKRGHAERAGFVLDRLRATAERSQAGLRSLLRARHADFTPFWIANAVKVRGDAKLLDALAARPEVARVVAERSHQLPKPTPAAAKAKVDAVEWGIDRIRAPEVWSTFGDRGEGIVVANVDTGGAVRPPGPGRQVPRQPRQRHLRPQLQLVRPVQHVRVALARSLRQRRARHPHHGHDGRRRRRPGRQPDRRRPARPLDRGQGLRVQQLLRLVAARLGPVDPRPDRSEQPQPAARPGPERRQQLLGWRPERPVLPGDRRQLGGGGHLPRVLQRQRRPRLRQRRLARRLHQHLLGRRVRRRQRDRRLLQPRAGRGRRRAEAVHRGARHGRALERPRQRLRRVLGDLDGIAARRRDGRPDVVGRAQPHRADRRDPAAARRHRDRHRRRHLWRDRRRQQRLRRGPPGRVRGGPGGAARAVRDARGDHHRRLDQPAARRRERAPGGPVRAHPHDRRRRPLQRNLSAGTYTVEATRFGYQPGNASVEVPAGATATADLALAAAARQQVSGHVTSDTGAPVGDATVSVPGTPIAAATTDADGAYTLADVPAGEYDVTAAAGRCFDPQTAHLVVDGDETLDFTLPQDADAFGYRCAPAPFAFIDANTPLAVSGDDASTQVALPFRFPFYGKSYEAAHVSTNGVVNFLGPNAAFSNVPIPNPAVPNAAAYAFWDDLVVDDAASVRTELVGDAPNRRFAIEWRNVRLLAISTDRVTFEAVLHENGKLVFQYKDISDNRERGNSATIGIEDEAGAVALQYANSEPVLDEGSALLFSPPPSALARGTVTDANDHLGVAGATVKALHGDEVAGETTTDGTGAYQLRLPLGSYTLQASATNYQSAAAEVTLDQADEVVQQDFSLATAAITVQPASLELAVRPSQLRSTQLTIGNSGGLDLTWQLSDNAPWLSVGPASGRVAPGGTRTLDLTVNTNGLAPGTVDATITIRSSAGRAPTKAVGFRLVVPRYQVALNAGGGRHVDRSGAPWSADRAWSAGGAGYVGGGQVVRSSEPIQRTDDDPLYQDQRAGAVEYRFDGLAPGVYQVELRFAELEGKAAGARVFDVQVEGATVLAGLDVTAEASRLTADEHTLFVSVGDRQLNLRLVPRTGQPILNAIRVTARPDRAA